MRSSLPFQISLATAAFLCTAAFAPAAEPTSRPAISHGPVLQAKELRPPPKVTRLTVSPAAEPVPAMKVRFVTDILDQKEGNALGCYHRLMGAARDPLFGRKSRKANPWLKVPLAQLPRAEVRTFLAQYATYFEDFELAARRARCDWELPVGERGLGIFAPPCNQYATLARLLALKARLHVAEGEYEKAVDTIRICLVNARHVASCRRLIFSLVAVAMVKVTVQPIMDLIESPGGENLYWALSELPRPIISMRESLEFELSVLYAAFPYLRTVRTQPFDERKWDETFISLMTRNSSKSRAKNETLVSLAYVFTAAAVYPETKKSLIRRGRPRKEVEAMPVKQVLAIGQLNAFDRYRDEALKWFRLPFWQADERLGELATRLRAAPLREPISVLATMTIPAVGYAHWTATEADQQLAALRCVEAVRMYAAAHDGRCPESLADIRRVPVPLDPISGKPFGYKGGERRFTLTLADSTSFRQRRASVLEVTLRRKPASGGDR